MIWWYREFTEYLKFLELIEIFALKLDGLRKNNCVETIFTQKLLANFTNNSKDM